MAKIRIYEWAKKNHIKSTEIVKTLNQKGYKIRNHTSIVDDTILKKYFLPGDKRSIPEKKIESSKQNHSIKNERKKEDSKKASPIKDTRKKTDYKKSEKPSPTRENLQSEKKTVNKKRNTNAKNRYKYDRFKMFDKEETQEDAGKTKTQIKKEAREKRQKELAEEITIVEFSEDMTVAKFAAEINIPVTDIVSKLFELGIMATVNQSLSREVADVLADEYNIEIKDDINEKNLEFDNLLPDFGDYKKEKRPPIVTIMGHVDHGKTTLLDYLRKSNITKKEAGGITQHIGAYQIEKNKQKITFLDTPGHAAFSEMRARGADLTDIAILVVAADDGVKPQTKEAIDHLKSSKTPLIVAINKIDKDGINLEKIYGELAENDVVVEEWGGDVPAIKISALKGTGIDELLGYIKLLSDLHEKKVSFEGRGIGTVIEAHLDKGRGAVATILLEEGVLQEKDPIVIGNTYGSIRVMQDEYGNRHKKISPSMPVEITGIKEVPDSGDKFFVAESLKEAQDIGEKRAALQLKKDRGGAHALSLEELNNLIKEGDIKELPVIIKSDVRGSSEALASSLEKIDVEGVRVRVVSKGVGAITESDVLLATANNTIIIGFNVRPDSGAKNKIEFEKIDIILNNVIYKIIEQIEDAMKGMQEKKYTEEVIGMAAVEEIFKISGIGKVAGAVVTEGKITRDSKMRLVRDGVVLYDGDIGQLKRYKDDVSEVVEGQDCGISFKDYSDLKKGDELEAYNVEEIKN